MRRFSLVSLAATAMLIAVPTGASAATQIGQTFISSAFDCTGSSTYFQQATAPASPSYTVPAGGGVITSWRTQAVSGGAEVKFAAFRPTGTPSRFTTIGSSAMRTIQAIQLNTFSTQIPVQGGETIGLLIFSGSHQCYRAGFENAEGDTAQRDATAVHDTGSTFTYADPSDPTRINVSANVEPDCDSDGLGDETQDTDLSSCPPGLNGETVVTSHPREGGGYVLEVTAAPGQLNRIVYEDASVNTAAAIRDTVGVIDDSPKCEQVDAETVECKLQGLRRVVGDSGDRGDTLLFKYFERQDNNSVWLMGPGADEATVAGLLTARGQGGGDTLQGRRGNQRLLGGRGGDHITGGRGNNDYCDGQAGDDSGGAGCETKISL